MNFNNAHLVGDKRMETTDMLVDLLADDDKLVSDNRRVYPAKHDTSDDELDDNVDDILNTPININTNTNNKSHAETYTKSKPSIKVDNAFSSTGNYKSAATETPKTNNDNDSENAEEKMTPEQLMLEKLDMLRKLGGLAEAGVTLSQNYTMNSDLKMMKFEYELHKSIRGKKNSINWMSSMCLNAIYGIEMLNDRYDPFSLKLKGWSEQMNADIDNYYDVFGELYEKYSTPGKSMAPELKLLLMISGGALKFHLSNQVINSLPNLNSALDENPQLIEKLRQQTTVNKINENVKKQNLTLNDKMKKEHEESVRKAEDLQMLRNKEIEYIQLQKQNAEKQANIQRLTQSLANNMKPVQSQPVHQQPMQQQSMQQQVLQQPVLSPELAHILKQSTNSDLMLQQERERNKTLENEINNMKRQHEYALKMSELKNMQELHQSSKIRLIDNDNNSVASSKTSKTSLSSKSAVSFNPQIADIFQKKKTVKNKSFTDKIQIENNSDDIHDEITHVSLGSKKPKNAAKKAQN